MKPSEDPVSSSPVAQSYALTTLAAAGVLLALAMLLLSLGAPLLVPLSEALLVWFIINAFARSLRKSKNLGRYFSERSSIWCAVLVVTFVGLAVVYSGATSVAAFGPQALRFQTSLDPLLNQVAGFVGAESGVVLSRTIDAIGLEALMRQMVLGLIGLINQFGIVALYVAFLLADQAFFQAKMKILFPEPDRRYVVEMFLSDLETRIAAYLWLMTKLSSTVALGSLIVMVSIGLEQPVFWAMLIFLLNFIPVIGSFLGTLLPSAFALVQFQEFGPFLVLLVCLGLIQFVVGNVILPRLAGKSLNLGLITTMLCLAFWGALWGVTGMVLAVPLTAILLLIASRFEATKFIAVALSKTGELPPTPKTLTTLKKL